MTAVCVCLQDEEPRPCAGVACGAPGCAQNPPTAGELAAETAPQAACALNGPPRSISRESVYTRIGPRRWRKD